MVAKRTGDKSVGFDWVVSARLQRGHLVDASVRWSSIANHPSGGWRTRINDEFGHKRGIHHLWIRCVSLLVRKTLLGTG